MLLHRYACLACLLAALAWPAPSAADCCERESDTQAMNRNLKLSYTVFQNGEVSDVLWGPPTGQYRDLLFEANIAPPFFLFSRRGINPKDIAIGSHSLFPNAHHGAWLVVVVPKVTLRMLHEDSSPVASPSFMPRLDLYRRLHTRQAEGDDDDPGATVDFLLLRLSHHSNGQNGPYRDTLGRIDRDHGSWSTNFVEVGLSRRMPGLPALVPWMRDENRFVDGYLSVEIHPRPGQWNRDAVSTDGYAQARVHYSTSAQLWCGRDGKPCPWCGRRTRSESGTLHAEKSQLWLSVQTELLVGEMRSDFARSRRLGIRPRLLYRFGGPADTAFFVEGYWGQDYYNSHFDRYLRRGSLGIVIWPRPLGAEHLLGT